MWHVKRADKSICGPFPTKELSGMYRNGEIDDEDELWSSDSGTWAKTWQCKGMFLTVEEDESEEEADSSAPPPISDEEDLSYLDELGMGVSGLEGDYVCPFCWRMFDLGDLKFIAQHGDLVGDDVLGDGEMNRFVPTRFTPDGNAIDSGGVVCEKRACPVCHQHLSINYFDMPPLFLSLVGSPRSGKSVFLPSMLRVLRERCRAEFNISFVDTEVEQNTWISQNEHLIFDRGYLPDKNEVSHGDNNYRPVKINDMNVLLTMPAFFALRDERPHRPSNIKHLRRTLVIHDNAGEHYDAGGDDAGAPGIRHLLHSEAIMFLFDPTADAGFKQAYKDVENFGFVESGGYTYDQASTITNAIQLIMRHGRESGDIEKYNKPLIVIVAKADTLDESFNEILKTNPFIVNDMYEHVLDMQLLLQISYQIRELINKYSRTVVSTLESMANDIIYLPVSALGHSPFLDGDKQRINMDKLNPMWTDVPVLYILYRLGYLEGIKSPVIEDDLDEPKILRREEDKTTFVNPHHNGLSDTLPAIYYDVKLMSPFAESEFVIRSGDKQT